MLRQALDAADAEAGQRQQQQQQRQQQHQETTTAVDETTALIMASSDRSGSAPSPNYDAAMMTTTTESALLLETEEEEDENNEDEDDEEEDEDEDDEEEDEEDYLDEWQDDDDEVLFDDGVVVSPYAKLWMRIKGIFIIVANVENLWDTPPDPQTAHSSAQQSRLRRNRNLIVLFWFVVLASSYAGERSTFKLLVDRAGPFRLFSVEMVTATHAILLGFGMLLSCCTVKRQQQHLGSRSSSSQQQQPLPLGISIVDVGLMALLDTVTLLLVFLTGNHVPPTLTVILVQLTIPLTVLITQMVHPHGRCRCCCPSTVVVSPAQQQQQQQQQSPENGQTTTSTSTTTDSSNAPELAALVDPTQQQQDAFLGHGNGANLPAAAEEGDAVQHREGTPLENWGGLSAEHVWGSVIIFVAVFLALCPAFYALLDPDFFIYADTIPTRTAYNTLLYACSCIPAASSQLYKEHVFLQYKQPVNMTYLNLLLSIFQFVFASIMLPLVFGLQGLGTRGDWTKLYPSTEFTENFADGLKCFFRQLDDDDQENKYPDEARCDLGLLLVFLHAFSTIAVGMAVDKIVNAGATKVMYRGLSAGIILAVLSMHFYDMHLTEFSYGPVVDGLNLACLILLILGSEVYHRVGLQESTFETVYPELRSCYEDDY